MPWSRWHWMIVIGLGTVWILDGLEVTIVGSMSAALKPEGTGLGMSSADIGLAGAIYVAGACVGALFFGQLTDRFGRKKLFMITLAVYLLGTVLTAFSMNPMWYFACRFITGTGIGGEYAAINSAIDELIPKKYRGRVDVAINGSFWIGAAGGSLLTVVLLNEAIIDPSWGWRIAFALGAVLAFGILFVRKAVPESPRWLFIHGREEEAERIVSDIEGRVRHDTGTDLPAVDDDSIRIRQRKTISLVLIARTVFALYPRRTILCFALFVGQAFLYNAFFFTYGDTLTTFLGVEQTGWYLAIFAVSNFAGALLLSPLFDKLGRVPMITGTYVTSGVLLAIAGIMLGSFDAVTLTIAGAIIFFIASAGASAAYLTASEIFPMETRALCIAFFYAIGTAAGGISGPLLFGRLIDDASASGDITGLAIGYFIGAALMIAGGIAEAILGVKAEGQSLENIAKPLTVEDAEPSAPNPA
ncbi:MFS family permease [Nocardioides luteus]|nr:MFS transporter [Nocardioides luteus]MDR7311474.1 MFS family permease [Nocardioides luteus]